jgi:hypothetical protein
MSKVQVLVGTKKGAFIITSNSKRANWDVSGKDWLKRSFYFAIRFPANICARIG